MKIMVIQGSPRKKWNTAQLTQKFVEGMKSQRDDLEIKEINVYDYNYTGCKSCFACKLKRFENEPIQCRIKDDIHDVLQEVRNSDVVVIGSPIYFLDFSAQLKAFLERLMYPGKSPKVIPAAFITTMNAQEDSFEKVIKNSIQITLNYWNGNFGYQPKLIYSCDTYQRDNEQIYKKSSHDMASKKQRHDLIWEDELNRVYQEGIDFIKEVGE